MHYFPHRCGGLSPITMIDLYRSQMARLKLLQQYSAVVTHSEHMLKELLKHGVAPERAHRLPFLVETTSANDAPDQIQRSNRVCSTNPTTCSARQRDRAQLIFSGRMEQVKGGQVLLDSLVEVQRLLGRDVSLVFVGDGPKRCEWERQAEQLRRRHPSLTIEFVGWLEQENLGTQLAQADVMVVPSLWPEPFGLAGPEAALLGVPAVAFDVGGVSEWLVDGVNGYLAPADPPSAAGLAQAIARCFRDDQTHSQLRQGALRLAGRYSVDAHLTSLMKVFNAVVAANPAGPS
jgi:glycosyltransferase involved in cell wall biosynthesis